MATLEELTIRNPILLQEARIIATLPARQRVGESHSKLTYGASFYTLDKFQSEYLEIEIYGGIKKVEDTRSYFINSLANLLLLDESFPEFREIMPIFMGGLVDSKGDMIGILMEDFSEGGRYIPYEMRASRLIIPAQIRACTSEPHIERGGDFDYAFFEVNGKVRLGDLNSIPWNREYWGRRLDKLVHLQDPTILEPHLIRL